MWKLLLLISMQLVLFGEIVLAQKVMYEKFGNDFLVHFVTKGFPSAHCPPDLAEQYCQKLQVMGSSYKFLMYISKERLSLGILHFYSCVSFVYLDMNFY